MRTGVVERKTRETEISVVLNVDGEGNSVISTGIGFFDHMLEAFAKHSGYDINVSAVGDVHVDCHHTIEDVGICLGKAFGEAVGDKTGIARYASFHIPMDEALAFCAVDVCGRPFIVFNANFSSDAIGDYDTQATLEFFRAFAYNAMLTVHLNIQGENDHHKTEAAFKAFAHALSAATAKTLGMGLMSTKGVL